MTRSQNKGTEPTPLELRPRFSLGGEDNWQLCIQQLREAGAGVEVITGFSAEYEGYLTDTGSGIIALTNAADVCGIKLHWTT